MAIANKLFFVCDKRLLVGAVLLRMEKKYDCIIGHEPSPIFQAYPSLLLRKLRKTPFYYWIMDLWPDAMMSGGGVKNKRVLGFIDKLVKGHIQADG